MTSVRDAIIDKLPEIAYGELTPLHKGTIATFSRNLGVRNINPFRMFGDRSFCTHYDSQFDSEGFEVEALEGETDSRAYCQNRRVKRPHGFLCEYHDRMLNPKPTHSFTEFDNRLDARVLAINEATLIKGLKTRSVRLLTDDPTIKLHEVGFMKVVVE